MASKKLFTTGLTATAITATEPLGTLREDKYGNVFRFVKNKSATALSTSSPVCYDITDIAKLDAMYGKVLACATADLAADLLAGLVMQALGASGSTSNVSGDHGWIQGRGYYQDAKVRTPATAAIVIGGALDGENGGANLVYTAATAGIAAIKSRHIRSLETLATDATGTAVATKDVQLFCL